MYIYIYMYIFNKYSTTVRWNAKCHITSLLRAGVEYLFYYAPNSQS